MAEAPRDAVYYASTIYLGHSYTARVESGATALSEELGAEFRGYGGSIKAFTESHNLQASFVARGLRPKIEASTFVVRSEQDILANYLVFGPAVPIAVEYRKIPGRRGH